MSCLNFIILKVNGIDVSNSPHEEAVQLFLKAQDPITVEVRRRTPDDVNKLSFFDEIPPSSGEPADSLIQLRQQQQSTNVVYGSGSGSGSGNKMLSSIACQTDISTTAVIGIATAASAPAPAAAAAAAAAVVGGIFLSKCGATEQTLEGDAISSPQHYCHTESQNVFNEYLAPEIDIEEITLHKSRSDERLGFTVSYSSGNGSASDSGSDDDEDDEDTCADIYISDILPDSLAARDGRLRQGDQILQINGRDVSNKDETESLFAENKNAITLLVSRCLYTDDEFLDSAVYCDDKDHNIGGQSSCECEQNTFSSKSSNSNSENYKNKLQSIVPIDMGICDHLSHDKIKAQLESVNKEISLLNSQISNMKLQKESTTTTTTTTTIICSKSSPAVITKNKKFENIVTGSASVGAAIENSPTVGSGTGRIGRTGGVSSIGVNLIKKITDLKDPSKVSFAAAPLNPECIADIEHIYETIPEDSETDSYYCSPYESKDQSRVEQWLKSQSCAIINSGIGSSSGGVSGGGTAAEGGERSGNNITENTPKNIKDLYLNQLTCNRVCKNNSSGDDYENSSSAYNTGGSCNSNPLTFELKQDDKNQSSSTLVFRPYSRQLETVDNCKQCQRYRKEKLSPKNKKFLGKTTTELVSNTTTMIASSGTSRGGQQTAIQTLPSSTGTVYTNVENLHQTIKLQQKLFRKALLRQNSTLQSRTATPAPSNTNSGVGGGGVSGVTGIGNCGGGGAGGVFIAPNLTQYQFVSSQQEQKSEQMVWKVKKRPDGSRYIVRRPVKSQLLQDRAKRINEERSLTRTTTDDETVSEIKVRRYWTKDERKRHTEKSKERRQRQEMLISAKKNQTQQWLV